MKVPHLVLMIVLAAGSAAAQQKEDPGVTPLPAPAWPLDGAIPAELRDRYIFVDPLRGEFVVAFPENLGTPEFEKTPGELEMRRFELGRNVEPSISVAITPGGGTYKYEYSVANAAAAKDWIDNWNILLPDRPGATVAASPANWLSSVQTGRSFAVKYPEWIRTGSSAFWFNGSIQGQTVVDIKPVGMVQPGTAQTGFVLESDLRPGFTLAYFRKFIGSSGPDPAYPEAVRTQMAELMKLEYSSRTVVTMGPKFDKNTPDKAVAADFIEGIHFFARSGALDPNSDFVKTTLAELIQYERTTRDKAAAGVLRLSSPPRTPVESEIAAGLKASLRLN